VWLTLLCCVPRAPSMEPAGQALEELLLEAQKQGAVTVGVYEAAKLLNV